MMKSLLTCDGMRIGNAFVPPFEVSTGDYIGIAFPLDYGVHWNELLRFFAGLNPTSAIHVTARSSAISPPGFHPLAEKAKSKNLLDIVEQNGLPKTSGEQMIGNLGLVPTRTYRDLQLNPRLLFDLNLSWQLGAELVVFSTAGLDPKGILDANAHVLRMLENTAAIHVFSTSLIDTCRLSFFSKVIRCSLLNRK